MISHTKTFFLNIFLLLNIFSSINGYSQSEKTIVPFKLKSTSGKEFDLAKYSNAKGIAVIFTSNNCPFAKLYPNRLNSIVEKYKKDQVYVVAIRSTDTTISLEDKFEDMCMYATSNHLKYEYLADDNQSVAKQFGARKTPHAFLIWNEAGNWKIKYEGAIDDNGASPEDVKEKFLESAIEQLLAGKSVVKKKTSSVGCTIHYYK